MSPNLQAFMAICRCKTVLSAAKVLGIGQTGVTQRIKLLEQELGTSLFLRSRKGMELTSEGKSLVKHCKFVEESEGKLFSELKGRGTVRDVDLKIAGPTSLMSGRVISQCTPLFMKWPRLNINFVIDDSDDRTCLLKNGLADIVALYPNQVALEFDSKLVKPDEYLLVCHPSWKDRSISEILGEERLFSFHENDPTSLNYLKNYNLLKFLKRPRMFVNENLALTKLLTSGVGCGILIKEIAAPLLKDKMLIALNEGKSMKEPMAFAWYPRQQMLPYFKDVLEALK